MYSQMADSLLPAPASITSQECDYKWVRRPMGGSVLRLDIPRDAVSFDCNIKSARGHTSIHMTPWESCSHYKKWNEGSYPPHDKTHQLIENFRAAERRARAILNSRRISLNHTTQIGWMRPGRTTTHSPDALPILTTSPIMRQEMKQPTGTTRGQLSHPLKVSMEKTGWDKKTWLLGTPWTFNTDEEVFHHSKGRAPTVADPGPHSPDSISSSLIPYGMGEDSSPKEDQGQQDQAPEHMDAEEEDPPMEEATSKLRMGLHVGPAKYQPTSPKYLRAEEEDGDVEVPYLAPREGPESRTALKMAPLH